jgi:DNA replication protein DnaC
VLDDWGLVPVGDQERHDLLEILEDRCDTRATIITRQLAPALWHDHLGHPTLADPICDRVVHHGHRIELKGESMRKVRAKPAQEG